MSATRTQVYLTEDQRGAIDKMAELEHRTMADIVREALDLYLDQKHVDKEKVLIETFGSMKPPSYPVREDWDRGYG